MELSCSQQNVRDDVWNFQTKALKEWLCMFHSLFPISLDKTQKVIMVELQDGKTWIPFKGGLPNDQDQPFELLLFGLFWFFFSEKFLLCWGHYNLGVCYHRQVC